MVQEKIEITELTQFLLDISPQNVMEIGSKLGGTFSILCDIATGKKISLDLPGGIHGGWITKNHPYLGDLYKLRNNYFLTNYNNVFTYTGDSHSSSTLHDIKNILKDEKLDFLFIDGDHTYKGVKQDFEMYKSLVSPGGWIGFHDINDTNHHRELNVHVGKFWNELKGVKREFNIKKHWAGIGVIQV
jgi:cephalosporin hydroxylase